MGSDDSLTELSALCACGHLIPHRRADCGGDAEPFLGEQGSCPSACAEAHTYSGSCILRADGPRSDTPEWDRAEAAWRAAQREESNGPPLAQEDEGEAICGNCYTDHAQGSCEPAEPPPQPLRRPPYAVAYSVGGHLYEIALPGDATVHATDGGLIITHALGPVAGVVRVHPIEGEQS